VKLSLPGLVAGGGKQVASDCHGGNKTGNALPLGGITISVDVIFFAF